MEHLQPSLMSIANHYFKNKDYLKAWSIYTYLSYLDSYSYCKNYQCYCEKYIPARYMRMDVSQRKMSLFVADILSKDGYVTHFHAMQASCAHDKEPEYLLAIANLFKYHTEEWLYYINKYLQAYECAAISHEPRSEAANASEQNCLASLVSENAKEESAMPLVTVCMSCFNSEKTIAYALKSLLNQSYKNLEVYVIDDNSTDNTAALVQHIADSDDRVTFLQNDINCGTYVNRNRVYKMAKGKYFSVLDADDYALPDRFKAQVELLENNPETMATLSNWLRMTSEGTACFKFGAGAYLHESVATMMIRTEQVRQAIGYWDCVRIAADTEYMHRIKREFGDASVSLMKRPTTFALYHDKSLTCCKDTGITEEEGLSPVRLNYRTAWKRWHLATSSLFLDFPIKDRPFQLPNGMPVGMVA